LWKSSQSMARTPLARCANMSLPSARLSDPRVAHEIARNAFRNVAVLRFIGAEKEKR
jgi:hypothetical protein